MLTTVVICLWSMAWKHKASTEVYNAVNRGRMMRLPMLVPAGTMWKRICVGWKSVFCFPELIGIGLLDKRDDAK
jgi:hypothetical protein